MWNPDQYHRYSNERSRPFFDLVGQITLTSPAYIVDLGCGTGELTATLVERWPQAQIVGVDNSPEMLAKAEKYAIPGRLRFELGDLATWEAAAPLDVIVSNAAFHWTPDHDRLLPRLVAMLNPGGCLAFQVPGQFKARELLDEVRFRSHWRDKAGQSESLNIAPSAAYYVDLLAQAGLQVNVWETTYLHLLQGENPVVEWIKGTAMRPVLAALSVEDQHAFLQEFGAEVHKAYPAKSYGTLMPFLRLFIVAYKT